MPRITKLTMLTIAAAVLLAVVSRHSLVAAGPGSSANHPLSAGSSYTVELSVMGVQQTFKVLETKGDMWVRVQTDGDTYWLNTAHIMTIRPVKAR